MNKSFIIGNLTRDPEMRRTEKGVTYTRFTVAVNRPSSQENAADFFTVIAWRELGETVNKYLRKGRKCAVTGPMQMRRYEGDDGVQRVAWELIAKEVEFLTPRMQGDEGDPQDPEERKVATAEDCVPVDPGEENPF